MLEREYFSFRYAVPGYTFILLLVSINLFPLLRLLADIRASEIFGAFLAFLSLLTGSALGFLIAQIYWWRFKAAGGFFRIKGTEPIKELLRKKCGGYKVKIPEAYQNEVFEAISDFLNSHIESKATLGYSARRWDMYHVLGSTLWSLFLGSLVGAGFRIYFEVFLLRTWLFFGFNYGFWAELTLLIVIFGCAFFLFMITWKRGRRRLASEYCLIMTAFTKRKLDFIGKREDRDNEFKEIVALICSKVHDTYLH